MPDFVLYLHRFFEGFLAIASYTGTFIHLDWSISFIEKVGLRRLKKKRQAKAKSKNQTFTAIVDIPRKIFSHYNMMESKISGQPRH